MPNMVLARGFAALCAVSVIRAGATSLLDSPESYECLDHRIRLARVLQDAGELERRLRIVQREVEEAQRLVVAQQRALSSCQLSSSTTGYMLPQHPPASDGRNDSEVSAARTQHCVFCATTAFEARRCTEALCHDAGMGQHDGHHDRGSPPALGAQRLLLQAGMSPQCR